MIHSNIYLTVDNQPLRLKINMKNFLLAFIPLFVAVDAIGVLPMFLLPGSCSVGHTHQQASRERRRNDSIQNREPAADRHCHDDY